MTYTPRVLVVDDEPVVIKSCDRILRPQGIEVEGAASGGYGLELAAKSRFDALLLDLKMPDANGIDVLREVKQTKPELEVVIITGYPSVNTAVDAMRLGACDYVVKPFTPEALTEAVTNALRQRKRLDRAKAVAAQLAPTLKRRPMPFAGQGRSIRTITHNGTRFAIVGLCGTFGPHSGVFPALVDSLKRTNAPVTAVYGSHEVEGKEILGYLEDSDKIVVVTQARLDANSDSVIKFRPGDTGAAALATKFLGFPQIVNWAKAVGVESSLVVFGIAPVDEEGACRLADGVRQELVGSILAELL